jgi:hypothetical protein
VVRKAGLVFEGQPDRDANRLSACLEGSLVRCFHVARSAAGDHGVPGQGEGASELLGPSIVLFAGLAPSGTEHRHAFRDPRERLEALDELGHDAEDPPGVVGREVRIVQAPLHQGIAMIGGGPVEIKRGVTIRWCRALTKRGGKPPVNGGSG